MKTRIQVNPRYASLTHYLQTLPQIFDSEGREIYRDRNVVKVLTAPDGTLLNVKRFCIPQGPNRLVYSLGIRQPKGLRAFRYPTRLLERGICTPEPVAYLEQRSGILLCKSYFVSLQCPYEHTLKDVANAAPEVYEPLARALGRFTADLHNRQVLHCDYSPGNVLYTVDPQGNYRFALVDINRMHFGPVSPDRGCANFARLWGPKRFFLLLVRAYAEARSLDADRCEAYALKVRRRFWLHFSKRHKVLFALEL